MKSPFEKGGFRGILDALDPHQSFAAPGEQVARELLC